MTQSAICVTREVPHNRSNYRAEQYDSDLGLYYLRARYYNPLNGRFLSRYPLDGHTWDPKTLHKYLYAGGDPINAFDPTGRDLSETVTLYARAIKKVLVAAPTIVAGLAGAIGCIATVLPDLMDVEIQDKEGFKQMEAACLGVALFNIAQGSASLF